MTEPDESINQILPNFLIVGAQKAGTTSLFEILLQHPRIFLPKKKEIHFFDKEKNFTKGTAWYASKFKRAKGKVAIGEATPSYLFLPEVPQRIKKTLSKDVKIIIILRNPADRALSHYRMSVNQGYEQRSLDEAFEANIESLKLGYNFNPVNSYLDRGFYCFQIENYFAHFPSENIRVFLFEEDFVARRKKMITEIQNFLGVDIEELSPYIKTVPAGKLKSPKLDTMIQPGHPVNRFFKALLPSPKMRMLVKYQLNKLNTKQETIDGVKGWKRRLIREVYHEDILKTEKLIGRNLSVWLA